jgi:gliding motility-associated-like protein
MKFVVYLSSLLILTTSQAQIITTVAGNGTIGYSGDGGPALNAQLGDMYYTYPAFDNLGNMYIAQYGNNTIRKIDITGIITTIAGTNGVIGYSGDGGPASNALLYHPGGIAIDNNNNIYIADQVSTVIRKIDPAGVITTVSGQFTDNCGVGDGGPLTLARFRAISAITFDQFNNLYVADYGCNTIRKVNTSGIITTIAGNGTLGYSGDGGPATQAQLRYPCKVGVDNAGNVYIPDAQNHRIRKVSTAGIITTFAGTGVQGYSGDGGPAINATMAFPGSVVIDNSGNLYFGDYNHVIRKIDASGNITRYGGNGIYGYSGDGGPAILASMALSEGRISIYNDNIFFPNYTQGGPGHTIRKISNCLTASITQQPSNITLCNPGNTSFSIVASNAGGYQWQLNTGTGWINITDNTTYTGSLTNTLNITGASVSMNNFQYRCILSNGCGSIFSTIALLQVNAPATPSIIVTTPSTSICTGTSVLFSSIVQNGGSSPSYQWKKNGINVGINSSTYNDNSLVNGDIISCTLSSNATCITGNTANSNSINISVTSPLTPSVTISSSANNICFGTPVTFTSSISNGGSTPVYTWFKNGINLSLNSPIYTDNSLSNGDIITCSVTSSLLCVTSSIATSSQIVMSVTQPVSPSVTIASSANSVCRNASVTFTASSLNGGSMPVYQWKKNGIIVGANNNVYSDNNLTSTDVISCTLTSNANCAAVPQVTSNSLSISIHPDPVVVLDKTNSICEGSSRILDAGIFASYLWNTGSTNRTIAINNIGLYSVTVTDINGCSGTDITNVATLLPSPKKFLPEDTSICSYGNLLLKTGSIFQSYLWSNGSYSNSITITQAGKYWLQVKNNEGCTGSDTVVVLAKNCLKGFFMPNAFTPNNDGINDIIKPILLGNVRQYQFNIYNRWGQLVFQTTDLSKGWNGTFKGLNQDGNVFVWMCSYQFENEPPQNKKGTFVLIR